MEHFTINTQEVLIIRLRLLLTLIDSISYSNYCSIDAFLLPWALLEIQQGLVNGHCSTWMVKSSCSRCQKNDAKNKCHQQMFSTNLFSWHKSWWRDSAEFVVSDFWKISFWTFAYLMRIFKSFRHIFLKCSLVKVHKLKIKVNDRKSTVCFATIFLKISV